MSLSIRQSLIPIYERATPERLNHVRSKLIRGTHLIDKYPIAYREQTLRIINDYAGFDEVQADEMQESLSKNISNIPIDEFVAQERFAPDDESFLRDLMLSVQRAMASMPMTYSKSKVEVGIDPQLQVELVDTFLGAAKQFIEGNMDRIPAQEHEQFKEVVKHFSSVQKDLPFQAYSAVLAEKYSPQVILKLDHGHMTQLIRDIVLTQKKSAASLPTLVLKDGASRSITYAIKMDGHMRGYLFGTAHYLDTIPWGRKLTKITKEVQARLYECAILGTEIRVHKDKTTPSNSIDETLVECASLRMIPNIGIDAEDRDDTFDSFVSDIQQAKKKEDDGEFEDIMFQAQETLRAIHDGDIERLRTSIEKRPPSKKESELMSGRNKEMADNIDVLLNACATVGDELGEKPPCAFFAVGTEHIVATKHNPNSVAELLAKKGWNVELLK